MPKKTISAEGRITTLLPFLLSAGTALIIGSSVGTKSVRIFLFSAFLLFQICCIFFLKLRLLPKIQKYDLLLRQLTEKVDSESPGTTDPAALLDAYTEGLLNKYEHQLTRKQASLNALQSQINPHFLYNTLDSIRGQALEYNIQEIADMTEALSSFFRYNVSKGSNMVPLRDELQNIRTYFKIQQYRFENRFTLSIENDDLRALDCYLPKLTLQPIVENSIFHGLERTGGQGHIVIRIQLTEKRLLLYISDDGSGISPENLFSIQEALRKGENRQGTSSGIALTNVNERIRLAFGPLYGLMITSQPQVGTDVEIILPLINKLEDINSTT